MQNIFVFHIVQAAGIFAAGYDAVIRGEARAVAYEFVHDFGFGLPFAHAGAGGLHGADVCQRADAAGFLEQADFGGIFD